MCLLIYIHTEPEFENVKGAQESVPPAYVVYLAGSRTLFVVPARQATKTSGIDSFLGSLNDDKYRLCTTLVSSVFLW